MKKFIAVLAILTGTLSAVFITQGLAHEIRRCRNNHCLQARPTTNRIFSFDSYQLRRQIEREARVNKNLGSKYTFWRNYNQQISKNYNKQTYSVYRSTHSSLFPRNNNVMPQPHKIAVRETAYHQNYKWDSLKRYSTTNKKETFAESGDGYVVEFPIDFIKTDDNKFYDAKRDLTVNVLKGDNYNCTGLSFQLCASQKSAESRENFENVKNLSQTFGLRQIKINGETFLAPTYRETFIVDEQINFFYSTMSPSSKNIVTLTGFAPVKNEFAASNLMNNVFRTIQL